MISTASRVGTGNIAGIATAIVAGGPGAVFWMWVMAIVGGASAFVESTLAQVYKVKMEKNSAEVHLIILNVPSANVGLEFSFPFC